MHKNIKLHRKMIFLGGGGNDPNQSERAFGKICYVSLLQKWPHLSPTKVLKITKGMLELCECVDLCLLQIFRCIVANI